MKNYFIAAIALLIFTCFGCNRKTSQLYSDSSVLNIQKLCEDSVTSWIKKHAAFPDFYTPLLFEKAVIGAVYNKGSEILPLRRYSIEHTFEIKTNSLELTHTTLVFELSPDYFVQYIRYRKSNSISLSHRIFPPDYILWTETYGRSFTLEDTVRWHANNRELLFELSEQFNLNRYNNSGDKNQSLTDSLHTAINRAYGHDNRRTAP